MKLQTDSSTKKVNAKLVNSLNLTDKDYKHFYRHEF